MFPGHVDFNQKTQSPFQGGMMSTLHILPKSSQIDVSLERALPLDIVASSLTPFDDDGTINFSLLKTHRLADNGGSGRSVPAV